MYLKNFKKISKTKINIYKNTKLNFGKREYSTKVNIFFSLLSTLSVGGAHIILRENL